MVDVEDYTSQVIALVGSYLTEKGVTRDNPCDNTGAEYENDVFLISAYNWNDEEEPLPNFWFKPLNYQVEWYKHLGRGNFANRPITIDDAYDMLNKCIASIETSAVVQTVPVEDEFWESDYEE
jgi:hypothetical protein